ncbi:hypothetical protein PS659_03254 [Pseudomonas fluorescens]|uniref:Uncharacterized protein n=1 Tax=Pseudomonas fluorescens TaxID=294 RepID=A0A5E6U052_PSEFL|nr:hypothetical protein PS659_03254 [Pseudomonas fluorescens]
MLEQQAAHLVTDCRASTHIALTGAMQCLHCQRRNAFDRYCADFFIAISPQNRQRIVAIIFWPAAMFGHQTGWKNPHRIALFLQLPGPGLSTWTGLHQNHDMRWQLSEKLIKRLARLDSLLVAHLAENIFTGDLKDLLGQIDRQGCAGRQIGRRQGLINRTMIFHGLALAVDGCLDCHRGALTPRLGRVHPITRGRAIPVGAGLLAMDSNAPCLSGLPALSLTTIAAMR